jgi:SAM-dependent methyltransferase
MNNNNNTQDYWEHRGQFSYTYKGETFYTVTPIPYYYKRRQLLLKYINLFIESEDIKSVCDFGCGDGEYIRYFGNKYPDKNYFGVDISASMIERAKRTVSFAKFHVSANGITFKNKFDLIYSIAVFAHIEDKQIPLLFDNIYKHLNFPGRFILFEQTGHRRRQGKTWNRRTTDEYISLALKSGFRIEQRCLIVFPIHRFFEKKVHPLIIFFMKLFKVGHDSHERCLIANQSRTYQAISKIFLSISLMFAPPHLRR